MPSSSRNSRLLWARIVAILILLLVVYVKPRVTSWLNERDPATDVADNDHSSASAAGSDRTELIDPDEYIGVDSPDSRAPAIDSDRGADFDRGADPDRGEIRNAAERSDPPLAAGNAEAPAEAGSPSGTPAVASSDKASGSDRAGASERGPPGKLKLVDKARQKFQSTAGLLYVQGSADGHRLKHVLKHARDIPDKNIHDVFDGEGDRDTILAWIDIAYEAGKKGGRGTKVERQGGRVVYTVKMSQRIGYVGGRAGRRDNFPECRYLRLVVQNGNEVVTAYPSRSM